MGQPAYLCPCFKVTKKDIKKAIQDGASSFKEVKKATGLAQGCGHCKCAAKDYTKKRLKKDSPDREKKDKQKGKGR